MNKDIDEESLDKLTKIMNKKIVSYGAATLLDFTAIISTPFIVGEAFTKTDDEYLKKVILTSGVMLFAYEIDHGVRNLKMTKYLLEKKEKLCE